MQVSRPQGNVTTSISSFFPSDLLHACCLHTANCYHTLQAAMPTSAVSAGILFLQISCWISRPWSHAHILHAATGLLVHVGVWRSRSHLDRSMWWGSCRDKALTASLHSGFGVGPQPNLLICQAESRPCGQVDLGQIWELCEILGEILTSLSKEEINRQIHFDEKAFWDSWVILSSPFF